MAAIETIAVGRLKAADDNIRQDVGDVSELAASMKSVGVLEPLLVREGDNLVVAGARRLAAAKKAGLKEVPVIVRAFTEQERLEAMIVENLQRDDLTPLEEASAFQRLAELSLTQRDIAARVGRSQGHVAKRIALLALPEKVKKLVDSGGITQADAQELAKIKDDPKLVEKLAGKGSTTGNGYGRGISHQVEEEVQKREREKKHAAAIAALVKKGENVVEVKADSYGYQITLPEGMLEVKAQVYGGNAVEMKPAAHRKLACHAVALNPRTLETIEVCTTPANHPSKADQQKEANAKRDAEVKQQKQEHAEMTGRRRQFVRELIAARTDKDVLLELVFLVLVNDEGYRWAYGADDAEGEIACDLAGIEVADTPLDPDAEEADGSDVDELLAEAAAKSAAARLRVTFAIAAAKFEVKLNGGTWFSEAVYFDWLVKQGYKPSPLEKKRLEEASGIA